MKSWTKVSFSTESAS